MSASFARVLKILKRWDLLLAVSVITLLASIRLNSAVRALSPGTLTCPMN